MKLIIDIPDEAIKTTNIANDTLAYLECCTPRLLDMLRNGIPLPKGHGRLIDADELNEQEVPAIKKDGVVYVKLSTLQDLIDNAPTIIEADKAESEDDI